MSPTLKSPIDLAEYLFRRLQQCGVHSVHGVPGDYNLTALDYVPKLGMRWMGSVNELNAGYAADGYARLRHLGVIVTTFGVGELSAANAIAGSYAECVPVIHIVGTPSTASQRNGMLLHHTLGNGDYTVFSRMSAEITCASANLKDAETAAEQIDALITKVVLQSRPGYITLPSDMVTAKVDGSRLATPLTFSFAPNDPDREAYAVKEIIDALSAANKPCILVDACVVRHRALAETLAFVEASRLPTFVTPMGKAAIDEDRFNFGGVYAGTASEPGIRAFVESADLVLSIGGLQSDFNTAGFSVRLSSLNVIELHSTCVKARYAEFPHMRMNGILERLTSTAKSGTLHLRGQVAKTDSLSLKLCPNLSPVAGLGNVSIKSTRKEMPQPSAAQNWMAKEAGRPVATVHNPTDSILHDYFWPRMSTWLQPDDVVVTETGTSSFGIWNTRFPPGVRAINQVLWGSIGFATPAAVGAAAAIDDDRTHPSPSHLSRAVGTSHKRPGEGRVVLFTGDGSFQLTVQEVGTAIRHGLSPIIFLLQNKGFTIERFIHGIEEEYNDIAEWDYAGIPKVFGADVFIPLPAQLSSMANKAQAGTEKLERAFKSYIKSSPDPATANANKSTGSGAPHSSSSSDSGLDASPNASLAAQQRRAGLRKAKVWRIKTQTELEALLNDKLEWAETRCLRLIEMHIPWDDAPAALVQTATGAAALNSKV